MLKNEVGSNDGIYVSKFYEGNEYIAPRDISLDLVKVFLEMGVAKEVKEEVVIEKKVVEPIETKVVEPVEVKKVTTKKKAKSKTKK